MVGYLKWLLFKKKREKIDEDVIEHSSKGDYTSGNRMKGGGHGQEAIDYMDRHGIEYNITKTYPNGVRLGNVPNHTKKWKKTGSNQSWFPKDWDRRRIKMAGQIVAKGKRRKQKEAQTVEQGKQNDHKETQTGKVCGVNVGVIRNDGKISTIFPMFEQGPKWGRRKKQ